MGQQHGARLQSGKIHLRQAQQQAEHPAPQIPHIGGPLAGDFILRGGEQIDEQIAGGGKGRFCGLARGDAPLHLAV